MSVAEDLNRVARLSNAAAKRALDAMLALGPKPAGGAAAVLWEQNRVRLQNILDSCSRNVMALTAAAVLAGLADLDDEMRAIGAVAEEAQVRIARVAEVSGVLSAIGAILSLGTAVLGVAAAPSPATLAALADAGKRVAESV